MEGRFASAQSSSRSSDYAFRRTVAEALGRTRWGLLDAFRHASFMVNQVLTIGDYCQDGAAFSSRAVSPKILGPSRLCSGHFLWASVSPAPEELPFHVLVDHVIDGSSGVLVYGCLRFDAGLGSNREPVYHLTGGSHPRQILLRQCLWGKRPRLHHVQERQWNQSAFAMEARSTNSVLRTTLRAAGASPFNRPTNSSAAFAPRS